VAPLGQETAFTNETDELDRERVRLWYVAATRARELLVVPKVAVPARGKSWNSLLDLAVHGLPVLDRSAFPTTLGLAAKAEANAQTREAFVKEAVVIEAGRRRLKWTAPSRDEGASEPLVRSAESDLLPVGGDGEPGDAAEAVVVQGGRERGLVIHKLFEEVLTGETADDAASLAERAGVLVRELGQAIADDPAKGLAPKEIAGCVVRTLALPEIAEVRPRLLPEFSVYASADGDKVEEVTAGIADAIGVAADGTLEAVIDWKSDVRPTAEAVEHYRAQVRNYLAATDAKRGMLVFVTSGAVVAVDRKNGGAPALDPTLTAFQSLNSEPHPDKDAVAA
jgi:exodeoxyribonuclease-5